jgi:hypothetical protein
MARTLTPVKVGKLSTPAGVKTPKTLKMTSTPTPTKTGKLSTPVGDKTPKTKKVASTPTPVKAGKLSTSGEVKTPKALKGANTPTPVKADKLSAHKRVSTPKDKTPRLATTPTSAKAGNLSIRVPTTTNKTPKVSPIKTEWSSSGLVETTPVAGITAVATSKTPAAAKAGKTPKMSTIRKTVKAGKTPRPLWSEVVRRNLGKSSRKAGKQAVLQVPLPSKKTKKVFKLAVKTPRKTVSSRSALASTGHAESPEAIVIGRGELRAKPLALPKKGRKSEVRVIFRYRQYDTSVDGFPHLGLGGNYILKGHKKEEM